MEVSAIMKTAFKTGNDILTWMIRHNSIQRLGGGGGGESRVLTSVLEIPLPLLTTGSKEEGEGGVLKRREIGERISREEKIRLRDVRTENMQFVSLKSLSTEKAGINSLIHPRCLLPSAFFVPLHHRPIHYKATLFNPPLLVSPY